MLNEYCIADDLLTFLKCFDDNIPYLNKNSDLLDENEFMKQLCDNIEKKNKELLSE